MALDALVQLVLNPRPGDRWTERNETAFRSLLGGPHGRYPASAGKDFAVRAPDMAGEKGPSFAAYVHRSNPSSGPYGGMSFAHFPAEDMPCLLTLVVGTQGISPDDVILSRPGHARKVQAICGWLNHRFSKGSLIAWAKQDPVRIDLDVPENIRRQFTNYGPVFDKYSRVLYALFRSADREAVQTALAAFLDLLFEERGYAVLKSAEEDASAIRKGWFGYLFPSVSTEAVAKLLRRRRYLILQGPPGTGKTRMALQLLHQHYEGRGLSVQFHPNTTYETFVGGLAPVHGGGALGLQFSPQPGFLMRAAAEALLQPDRPFLLHVDEINRADLAKVLGEAIYLLEPDDPTPRGIRLAHDFGQPFGPTLYLPPNLHLVGTMNSSDRSIALVDVAVRRRFAFVKLWPDASAVEGLSGGLMQRAFEDLLSLFVEHAAGEALDLVPGHSYFLEKQDDLARHRLKLTLAPLLEEYLAQGFVGGFAEPVRAYLQWVNSL
jgi:5-methylcytosine-specific restriction protein B